MVGLVFVLGALPLILAGALIGGAGTAVNILLSMVLPISGSGDGWIYGGLLAMIAGVWMFIDGLRKLRRWHLTLKDQRWPTAQNRHGT